MKVLNKEVDKNSNKKTKIEFNVNSSLSNLEQNNSINSSNVNGNKKKTSTSIKLAPKNTLSKDFNDPNNINSSSQVNTNSNSTTGFKYNKSIQNTFRKKSSSNVSNTPVKELLSVNQNIINNNNNKQVILKDENLLNLSYSPTKILKKIREIPDKENEKDKQEESGLNSPYIRHYGHNQADDAEEREHSKFQLHGEKSSPSLKPSIKKLRGKSKSVTFNEADISNNSKNNSNFNNNSKLQRAESKTKPVKNISCISYKSSAGKINSFQSKTNQDSFLIMTNVLGLRAFTIMAVFDGHGAVGHLVSNHVKKFFEEFFGNAENYSLKTKNKYSVEEVYEKIVENSYRLLFNAFTLCEESLKDDVDFDTKLSGTTAVITICIGESVICANSGDSRAIMSCKTGVKSLSFDHKPEKPEEKERIINAGGKVHPSKEGGRFVGPCRVWSKNGGYPGLAMSRSLGDFMAKSVGCTYAPGKINI
jgi:serine/threonine protein phosphatase PrpC